MPRRHPALNRLRSRHELTTTDAAYLDAIKSSIVGTRWLLMIVALVSIWIIASELVELMRWEYLRPPFSQFVVKNALKAMHRSELPELKVPKSSLRACDKVRESKWCDEDDFVGSSRTEETDEMNDASGQESQPCMNYVSVSGGSNVSIRIPPDEQNVLIGLPDTTADYYEIIDWFQHYARFAYTQWDTYVIKEPLECKDQADSTGKRNSEEDGADRDRVSAIHLVSIILERAKVTEGKLPASVVKAPQTSVPMVGLSVSKEDIEMVAAAVLFLGMLWIALYVERVADSIDVAIDHFEQSGKARFLRRWLPGQFVFISEGKPVVRYSVFLMFFIPYIAILVTLAEDSFSQTYQFEAFHRLTGFSGRWQAFTAGLEHWSLSDVLGLRMARNALLLAVLFYLRRWGIEAGKHMLALGRHIEYTEYRRNWVSDNIRAARRKQLARVDGKALSRASWGVTIGAVTPVFLYYAGRWAAVKDSIDQYGWTYSPNTITVWISIGGLIVLAIWLRSRFKDIIRWHTSRSKAILGVDQSSHEAAGS